MKLKKKSRYIIFPHLSASLLLHFGILVAMILVYIFLGMDNGEVGNMILTIVAIVLPVLFVILFLTLNVFYWNAMIVIDPEKMTQRRGLHKRSIFWNEITDVTCTKGMNTYSASATLSFAPKVTFLTNSDSISIVMETRFCNVLQSVCPREELLSKIQKAA